jgi:hypothetical protein
MATRQLQTPIAARWASHWRGLGDAIEMRLEAERERIALWLPVALGARIALWLAMPTAMHWIGALLALTAGALAGLLISWQMRLGRSTVIGCGVVAAGMLLIWGRALWGAAPVLAQSVTNSFLPEVERVDGQLARGPMRLIVRHYTRADLPPLASLPGGYDFSQCARFDRLISDRWLPRECVGRWMTIDRDSLSETGGLALNLDERARGRRHAARGGRVSVAATAAT